MVTEREGASESGLLCDLINGERCGLKERSREFDSLSGEPLPDALSDFRAESSGEGPATHSGVFGQLGDG